MTSLLGQGAHGNRSLRLLQFPRIPISDDFTATLASGIRLLHALPDDTWLVWVPSNAAALGEGMTIADFPSEAAIDPRLDGVLFSPSRVTVTWQLVNVGEQSWRDYRTALDLGAIPLGDPAPALGTRYLNATVSLPGRLIPTLSAFDTTVFIEPVGQITFLSEVSGAILTNRTTVQDAREVPIPYDAPDGYLGWLRERMGIEAGGIDDPAEYPVVVVADQGIGSGDAANPEAPYPPPSDFRRAANGPSRVAFAMTWEAPGSDGGPGCRVRPGGALPGMGHGHFVASILAGYNDGRGPQSEDPKGFRYGMGVNPFGRIGSVQVPLVPFLDTDKVPPPCIASMVSTYWRMAAEANWPAFTKDGAIPDDVTVLANNCWGVFYPPERAYVYDAIAQSADQQARDAVPDSPGNQQLLAVCAAGNSGANGFNTVISPGLAKNTLCVGGSEGVDFRSDIPYCGANSEYNPYGAEPGRMADDANDIWIYASRGARTRRDRMKPDVVGPASMIYANGLDIVECTTPGDDHVPGTVAPRIYHRGPGTSFATPGVSAGAQLMTTFMKRRHGIKDLSPAALKALLVGSTKFLTGELTMREGARTPELPPSPFQGFGRFALDQLLTDEPIYVLDQTSVFENSARSTPFRMKGHAADPAKPVRVVLCWTDPPTALPGPRSGPIVNDLDLAVRLIPPSGDWRAYMGNWFELSKTGELLSRQFVPGKTMSRDRANNVESVRVKVRDAKEGVELTVQPARIAMDTFGSEGAVARQDFALVAFNFVPE